MPDNVDDIVADIAQEEKEEGLHLFIFSSKPTLRKRERERMRLLTVQYPKLFQSNQKENRFLERFTLGLRALFKT